MASRIEDYALIGDTHSAGLVGRDGSLDWLCLPRFDSGACFTRLLGSDENGAWSLAPVDEVKSISRRYRGPTLVLQTDYEVQDGVVRIIDFMPLRGEYPSVIRIVEGLRGHVRMRMRLCIRFDYGSIMPWVTRDGRTLRAVAGPDAIRFDSAVDLRGEDFVHVAEFVVTEGVRLPFTLTWCQSHEPQPPAPDAETALVGTESWWRRWSAQSTYAGEWQEPVLRSLITLKALTYGPTGGIVAAATTSLPERVGGVRNWDYRYCWLRDATFTLYSLMLAGFETEARAWREWLLRAVAGRPAELQIMYGAAGERRLTELELGWLEGYEGSRPVRVGNAAVEQFQLDVYGEIMDALHQARRMGSAPEVHAWALQRSLLGFLEEAWRQPDEGIWEVRGPRQHFTHSKVMAWVALDRGVRAVEGFGFEGPLDKWKALRNEIHREVCERGYDADRRTFTQFYGSTELDAACLMIPLVGFLPPSDPRVRGTMEAVERDLGRDGFVLRYSEEEGSTVDGLPPGEGSFLACSFWLADNYALAGRRDDALRLFEQLLSLRNDVGLLSEEYDPQARRMLGNFPQALSHVSLVNTAHNLVGTAGPAHHRRGDG